MRLTRVLARFAIFAVLATSTVAHAQTTGTIVGTIQDATNGNPIAGALVIAQSPALQGEQTALTGEEGTFRISLLPPGIYTVLVQADNYKPAERAGIRVDLDKTLRVTLQMVPSALQAEEVVVTTEAPVIDQSSTTSGAVIPENFSRNIPTGRSFEAVLNVAPSATSDGLGTTFRGSSSPENSWIIDGINTTDIIAANGSTSLPNDFIKQVEVKTGGYQAEYGRATGGVVNVVTKSGGNTFSGDAFVNFSSGALSLTKRSVGSVTSVVSSESNAALNLDFGFDLGGYIIKDKLWFFVGVTPFRNVTDYTRTVKPRVLDSAGDPVLDDAGNPTFGAPIPSLSGNTVSGSSLAITRIAKLTYNVNEDNSAQVSYYGNPTSFSGVNDTSLNGTDNAIRDREEGGAQDLSARWTSKLFDKNMLLEAWYGMHQQSASTLPYDAPSGPDDWATIYQYPYLPEEFANVSGCEPVVAGDPSTSPCASTGYATGPWWYQEDNYAIRHTANLKLTNFASFFGEHAIRYGGDIEFNRFLYKRGYAANWAQYKYRNRIYAARRQAIGSLNDANEFVPNEFFTSDTSTRNTSVYLQDSYQPIDGLTINAGLRWETQNLLGNADANGFSIMDNWGPRVGITYDWTGSGRSKLEAYYGRFYEAIPMDINGRALSPEGFGMQYLDENGNNITRDVFDYYYGPGAGEAFTSADGTYVLGGTTTYVSPGLMGQYVDEYSLGGEYEVLPDFAVGITLVHRNLGRAIEDVSPDGGNTYLIGNPGDQGAADRGVAILEDDIRSAGGTVDNGTYTCPDGNAACEEAVANVEVVRGVASFPKPERVYNGIEMMARKNFSRNWYLVGSLTLSKTVGNYPGLFDPGIGQLDPNITSQYDLIPLLANRYGPLRSDRPVYFKLDGYYLWDFGLVTGLSFRAFSGRPIDVLAADPSGAYGPRESYLLPRGAGGRLNPMFNLDVNLGYDLKITEDVKVNFNVNVFNLLNLQETANVDHSYTLDAVRPVVGGTFSDIEYTDQDGNVVPSILNVDGFQVEKNRNYKQPVSPVQVQDPLTLRLGLRVSF